MAIARELDLSQLGAFLNRQVEQLARLDFSKPLKTIAVLVKADIRENFQGSHTPDGRSWPPLKRKRSGKRHKNSTPKPLLDNGILAASMSANGEKHIEEISSHALKVGSNLDYAHFHQDGTRTIPQRAFAGFSSKLLTEIEEVLAEYLAQHSF